MHQMGYDPAVKSLIDYTDSAKKGYSNNLRNESDQVFSKQQRINRINHINR